ncbi:zinc-binding dehydrogenase [Streptacidiphilus rugosus]|uniref:zinc-binding dehydrogenase n=1 Tax=Streptacidiphilus rugosus TaxID=405783 RepID=UPI000565AB74|nr:zinc-binding dehydrogenase [Streptacidiphilus rugosus]
MTQTMLAGRLHLADQSLRMEEVPVPVPGTGHVLVKVEAAGVCLSDVHAIQGSLKPLHLEGDTVTLGHEVAGVIAELGPDVTDWAVGERVLLLSGQLRDGIAVTRGLDYDGGWAQYTLAKATTLVRIPDDLPFEQACFVPDAVSTPWAAITQTAAIRPAEATGVWGAGGLGVHGIQLLRLVGAAPIIAVDPLPAARDRALASGADLALDPADPALLDQVLKVTDGRGLDAALDFAGHPAVREQAMAALADGTLTPGGRLVLVGLTNQPVTIADGTAFSAGKKQLLGHWGSIPAHIHELVRLIRDHRLDLTHSVSAVLPLSEAPRAVEQLESKAGNPVRLVLKP